MFGDSYSINSSVFSNNTTNDPWNPMQCALAPANGSGDMQWPSTRDQRRCRLPCIHSTAFARPFIRQPITAG
jgi:hypothetical protein